MKNKHLEFLHVGSRQNPGRFQATDDTKQEEPGCPNGPGSGSALQLACQDFSSTRSQGRMKAELS